MENLSICASGFHLHPDETVGVMFYLELAAAGNDVFGYYHSLSDIFKEVCEHVHTVKKDN